MFERWRIRKEPKGNRDVKPQERANETGIGIRGDGGQAERVVDAKPRTGRAGQQSMMMEITNARNALIDSFDILGTPNGVAQLSRILGSFDFTLSAISSASTIITRQNLGKFFAVLEYTEQYLIEKIGTSTSGEEASRLTATALAIVQCRSLVLARASVRKDHSHDERFVEILRQIQDVIRAAVERRIRMGEGKELRSLSRVTLSGMEKLARKLSGKGHQRMSYEEEDGIVRELFNIKLSLSVPESSSLSAIADVTMEELDELFVLVYV